MNTVQPLWPNSTCRQAGGGAWGKWMGAHAPSPTSCSLVRVAYSSSTSIIGANSQGVIAQPRGKGMGGGGHGQGGHGGDAGRARGNQVGAALAPGHADMVLACRTTPHTYVRAWPCLATIHIHARTRTRTENTRARCSVPQSSLHFALGLV